MTRIRGSGLVDGARVLGLFGDVATELLIRHDGDEGCSAPMNLSNSSPRCTPAISSKWKGR